MPFRPRPLPLSDMAAWCRLNDVQFFDTAVQSDMRTLGNGVVTTKPLNSEEVFDVPTLLEVPKDLILGKDMLSEVARVDPAWRELREMVGGRSMKEDAMLFLLLQFTIAKQRDEGSDNLVGVECPWSEYVRFLPWVPPVPTMWEEEEKAFLEGTSIESPVNAKLAALRKDFERLQEKTSQISWCNTHWWDNNALNFYDWVCLDAQYRSRSLDVPLSGSVMVPCLDMVNHRSDANSFYAQTPAGDFCLALHQGKRLREGDEITINYGPTKSDAEMLFTYGFIDEQSHVYAIVLDLKPSQEDPLSRAKFAAYDGEATIQLTLSSDRKATSWTSPILYLLCLNEEDGLKFRVLQENDGSRSLKVFWHDEDVTDSTKTFETLISTHELVKVFRLRVLNMLTNRIGQQLTRIFESDIKLADQVLIVNGRRETYGKTLRSNETTMLEHAHKHITEQIQVLAQDEVVQRYLESMQDNNPESSESELEESDEEEDFS